MYVAEGVYVKPCILIMSKDISTKVSVLFYYMYVYVQAVLQNLYVYFQSMILDRNE